MRRFKPIKRPVIKGRSKWNIPPDEPLTPGLRRQDDVKTEAIGFTTSLTGDNYYENDDD